MNSCVRMVVLPSFAQEVSDCFAWENPAYLEAFNTDTEPEQAIFEQNASEYHHVQIPHSEIRKIPFSCHKDRLQLAVINFKRFPSFKQSFEKCEHLSIVSINNAVSEMIVCGGYAQPNCSITLSIWKLKLKPAGFSLTDVELLSHKEYNFLKHIGLNKQQLAVALKCNQSTNFIQLSYLVSVPQCNSVSFGVTLRDTQVMLFKWEWNTTTPQYLLTEEPLLVKSDVESPVILGAQLLSSSTNLAINFKSKIVLVNTLKKSENQKLTATFKLTTDEESLRWLEEGRMLGEIQAPHKRAEQDCASTPEAIFMPEVIKTDSEFVDASFGTLGMLTVSELVTGGLVLRLFPLCDPSSHKGAVLQLEPLGHKQYLFLLKLLPKERLIVRVYFTLQTQILTIEFFQIELGENKKLSLHLHTRLERKNLFQTTHPTMGQQICLFYPASDQSDKHSLIFTKPELKFPVIVHFVWNAETKLLEIEDQMYDLASPCPPAWKQLPACYVGVLKIESMLLKLRKLKMNTHVKDNQVAIGFTSAPQFSGLVLIGKDLFNLVLG